MVCGGLWCSGRPLYSAPRHLTASTDHFSLVASWCNGQGVGLSTHRSRVSRPTAGRFACRLTTLGKRLTHTCLCYPACSINGYRSTQGTVMLYSHGSQTSVVCPPTGSRIKEGRYALRLHSCKGYDTLYLDILVVNTWSGVCLCRSVRKRTFELNDLLTRDLARFFTLTPLCRSI